MSQMERTVALGLAQPVRRQWAAAVQKRCKTVHHGCVVFSLQQDRAKRWMTLPRSVL